MVDLEEFGLRGEEPEAVSALRNMIKEQDPDIYRLIVSDDGVAQRFMADPAQAWKDAQAIDPGLKRVAETIAAGGTRAERRERRKRERRLAEEAEADAAPVAA